MTPEAVVARLSAGFLSDRTDDWIVSFYRFLYRHPALWAEPAREGDVAALARSSPIVRLEDGTQVVPFDPRGGQPLTCRARPDGVRNGPARCRAAS